MGLPYNYRNYLANKVCVPGQADDYSLLFEALGSYIFVWDRFRFPRDANRAADGIGVRMEYNNEVESLEGYSGIARLDDHCTMLEMMYALAVRIEDFLRDINLGDRTNLWFWHMIKSLGLIEQDDNNFDAEYVEDVLVRFVTRTYGANGRGSLFAFESCSVDIRELEIWGQMSLFLQKFV